MAAMASMVITEARRRFIVVAVVLLLRFVVISFFCCLVCSHRFCTESDFQARGPGAIARPALAMSHFFA